VDWYYGRLPQALQHVLRLDPGHEPAQRLRKRVKDVEKLKDGNLTFKNWKLQEAINKYDECLEVSSIFFT
jgi:DnaJ homolog subfamily C member 7